MISKGKLNKKLDKTWFENLHFVDQIFRINKMRKMIRMQLGIL